ncbi:hypothetical protein [Paenibacillus eucommiae]|uniref:Uncharacterized protein n=1 Tax=Paenibacillus eucommiae TaxID=1355755 RepID=A0ABS4J3W3_9BACL|nr:hypothetical protein [Paenibacillus eucommiae]MBP1994532.1 hypothetical protein [Paenibacillus eucommiae]
MNMHYPLASSIVLDPARTQLLKAMKAAGLNKIWLHGYFYGHMASSLSDMVEAKSILEQLGFEVGIMNVPFNHQGNALNPDDPDMQLTLPDTWKYRIDRHGDPVYYCAEIEANMITDQIAAMEVLRDAGFTDIFLDDDTRQGNWSPEIEGSFSEESIVEFNEKWGRSESRESLSRRIEQKETSEILKEWMIFNSAKVTAFMKAVSLPGIRIGHMIMPDGDERQGLDVVAMQQAIPACMFRVGEHQYSDRAYGNPKGRALGYISTQKHLNRIGKEFAYSETTVFPDRALSADNLAFKAKMAVVAGISNIMFMSGTAVIAEDNWSVIQQELPKLQELEGYLAACEPEFPVHLVYSTHPVYQEPLETPTLATLAGLPVKPVRGTEKTPAGDILLVFGDYKLDEEWEPQLQGYKKVILDAAAARRNPERLNGQGGENIHVWNHEVGTASQEAEAAMLRELLQADEWEFPWLTAGDNVLLVWLKDSRRVLLVNLDEKEQACQLRYSGARQDVSVPSLAYRLLSL